MAAGSWVRFAIQFSATIAIARILGPSEYGAAAIIVVFGAAAELMRDSGFTTLVLQRARLGYELINSLHYLNAAIGIALGVGLAVCGPFLSSVFNNSQYGMYAAVLALIFVFAGLGAIPNALMARNFEFRKLAAIEIFAVILASGVGVGTAILNFGALALVVQSVVFMATQCLLVLAICPWRPGRPAKLKVVRGVLPYVWHVSFVQGLNYFSRNVDNLLIGFYFGPRAAGLYNQAYQLMVIPLQQINGPLQRVFVPILSRLYEEQERYRRFFHVIVLLVTTILWPSFVLMAVYADTLVVVLFGPEWIDSAEIFVPLAAAGMAQAVGYINAWLFISSGQIRRQTYWILATRPIIVGSFFLGIPWGTYGMAVSYAVASCLVIVPGFLVAHQRANLNIRDLVGPLLWPVIVTAVVGSMAIVLKTVYPPEEDFRMLLVELAVLAVVMGGMVWLILPLRSQIRLMIAHIRSSK